MSQSDIDCFGSYRGYVLRTKKVDRNEKKGEVDVLRTLLSLNMNRLCSIGEHKPEMYSVSQQVGEIIRTHSDYIHKTKKWSCNSPHTSDINSDSRSCKCPQRQGRWLYPVDGDGLVNGLQPGLNMLPRSKVYR